MEKQSLFIDYFTSVYRERWPKLLAALQQPERQVLRLNAYTHQPPSHFDSYQLHQDLASCYWQNPSDKYSPQRTADDLLDVYIMDPASVWAAKALDVQSGDRVLDMCAAPGGKSLILIESLKSSGEIFCNDLSPERRERLKKIIQQYVPRVVRDRVWVTGQDAVKFGLKEPGSFDRILLDAPCSGERHLIENKKELSLWTKRRSENLASRQYSLICSALLALKPGGRLVYSTCSISPLENDGVIAKLFKKKDGEIKNVIGQLPAQAEQTDYGVQFLPDGCGYGPIYYSVIEKC